jgi:hypothetical protein
MIPVESWKSLVCGTSAPAAPKREPLKGGFEFL